MRNICKHKITAGQCRTNPWPAVPDWPLMPECRCWNEKVDYRKKCPCRNIFVPVFRHLLMIFQHHIVRILPSPAVIGRAGCMTSNYLQFRREVGISSAGFRIRIDYCGSGSSIFFIADPDSGSGSRCKVPLLPPAVLPCRMHSSPSPAMWTCGVCMKPFSPL